MKKQNNLIFLGILLVFTIFLINFSSAELSYCCEKTATTNSGDGGAWCQNALEAECSARYCGKTAEGIGIPCKKAPTSCESTSYCKLGTCINVNEGTCSENTPQVVCQNAGGIWDEQPAENLGQCQLGCCAIGDQTAYVTQTRCKRLSSLYGLETNYRVDINSELECIITSQPDVEGACVFSREYERTCLRTTKKECQEFEASADKEDIEFYENYLCSNVDLGTNCGPSKKTTCVEGKDAVYYLDTCGNLANVYDSSKYDLENKEWKPGDYWTRIYTENESCELSRNLETGKFLNSDSCGSCDYFFGSTCQAYDIWKKTQDLSIYETNIPEPVLGDNICADLACEYDTDRSGKIDDDETYLHGETWCGTNTNLEKCKSGDKKCEKRNEKSIQSPGTNSYRYVCYDGEVTIEPCADFRQEVCKSAIISNEEKEDYHVAACVVNRWQDCFNQGNMDDCNNADQRDCHWVEGRRFDKVEEKEEEKKGYCVPNISSGYDFWEADTSAEDTCGMATIICTVTYEKGFLGRGVSNSFLGVGLGLFGDKKGTLKDKEHCVTDTGKEINSAWLTKQRDMCVALGDCGNQINYLKQPGYEHKDNDRTKDLGESNQE